jgi:uncharacterized protein (TIGR00255 family)
MTHSMTAFARHIVQGKLGQYTWEIRSVNHRYCELFVRLPEELRGLEATVRERFSKRLKRGKIDCGLRFEPGPQLANDVVVNEVQLEKLKAACAQVNEKIPGLAEFNALDVLKWPGVLDSARMDLADLEKEAIAGFDQALQQLLDTRGREGAKLADVIEAKCQAIGDIVLTMREIVPQIISSIKSRHEQRIADLAGGVDPARVEQECALLMQKLDVVEELDRLEAHLSEVKRVLNTNQPSGRRLDFLMQELNREANTLGSKSAHVDTANASIDLKVFIEQMREQIQNIE